MGLTLDEVALHGDTGPLEPARLLQSNTFSAGLETPSLRAVAIGGHEVAQTITFSVRDKNWGTIESAGWSTSIEDIGGSIRVDMAGRFTSDEIDLDAVLTIRTAPDGSLTYGVKATALRNFERARIGLCVMHPSTLSGKQLHITTPDETYSTRFPIEVSPSRAISNIVSLRHPLGDGRDVVFEFQGDLFEFEDQRNWTDASYKTFCTPLSLPWPVTVLSGDVIEQQIRISTIGQNPSPSAPAPALTSDSVSVQVDLDTRGRPAPSIGVLSETDPEALEAARILGTSHVRISIDTASRTATADLISVGETLDASDTAVELEIVADSPPDLLDLHAGIAQLGGRLQRVFVFDRKTQITTKAYAPAIDHLRSLTEALIGGGSGANFGAVNFNADDIAFDTLDVLTFPMSPQVHYTDHFSVIANLDAQAVVASNGRRLAHNSRLSIGPITLLPRRAGVPLERDPRSASLLGAAWTVASLSELIASGADALTYHQVGGPAGIIDHAGTLTPTYHVLADLSACNAARHLPVHVDSHRSRVAAVALRNQSGALILIANLEPESVSVGLDLPAGPFTIRSLDETTYDIARHDRAGFVETAMPWDGFEFRLLPFAVVTLKSGVATVGERPKPRPHEERHE